MKILVAEDDDYLCGILKSALEGSGYEVLTAPDGKQAWDILQGEDAPRLAILDRKMPGMNGLEICRMVREARTEPYTYIILLTALDQKKDIIAGMEAGADDYIAKPFDIDELEVRLKAGVRTVKLHENLVTVKEELIVKAARDSLTSLWNHGEIIAILERELNHADRKGTAVGVLMADLDKFKAVNDTYGHLAGDDVLKETAERLLSAMRPYDMVGRYGGEEFLIIIPECDCQSAASLAERICTSITAEAFQTSEGEIPVSISIGVSCSRKAGKAEKLIKEADDALYEAKNKGRNRFEIFSKDG